MEKYVINRNTPSMEPYILIDRNLGYAYKKVYHPINDGVEDLSITCFQIPVNKKIEWLSEGDILYFRKTLGGEVYVETPVKVLSIDGNMVSVETPGFGEAYNIIAYEEGDDMDIIHLDKQYEFLPYDFISYTGHTEDIFTAKTNFC